MCYSVAARRDKIKALKQPLYISVAGEVLYHGVTVFVSEITLSVPVEGTNKPFGKLLKKILAPLLYSWAIVILCCVAES